MKPPIELFIESKVLPEYQSIVVKFRALIKNFLILKKKCVEEPRNIMVFLFIEINE